MTLLPSHRDQLPLDPVELYQEQASNCVQLINAGFVACSLLEEHRQKRQKAEDALFKYKASSSDQDRELAAIKREAARLGDEKKQLLAKCESLMEEHACEKGRADSLDSKLIPCGMIWSPGSSTLPAGRVDDFIASQEYGERIYEDSRTLVRSFIERSRSSLPGVDEQFKLFRTLYPDMWPPPAPVEVAPEGDLPPAVGDVGGAGSTPL